MGFYDHLGVKRVINCFGTYTLIGGHTFSDHVRAAMDEADRNFAWLWELEEKAGARICEVTGAEAAFVTPGVFAALSMGAAACMAGTDRDKMSRLPDTSGMRNEFIVQRALRDFKYDRSMTVAGGRLVEVGDEKRGCTAEELEAAITDKTAGFHYMAHGTTGDWASKDCSIVPIEEVIDLAPTRPASSSAGRTSWTQWRSTASWARRAAPAAGSSSRRSRGRCMAACSAATRWTDPP